MSNSTAKPKLAIANQVPTTCMGLHVRRASRIMSQLYDAAFRPVGLVQTQFTLLVAIHLLEPVAITQLAQELFTDQTTITRNIKLLENRGLVAFSLGEDRRIKLASLTIDGKLVLEQALPLWEQAQTEVREHLGEQKWQDLLSLLSEVKTLNQRS
jgi:DNA-binding MarR family transcriptional regulator